MRKLWQSEVDAADSQGCAEMWAHPIGHSTWDFSIPEHSVQFRTVPKPLETGI